MDNTSVSSVYLSTNIFRDTATTNSLFSHHTTTQSEPITYQLM